MVDERVQPVPPKSLRLSELIVAAAYGPTPLLKGSDVRLWVDIVSNRNQRLAERPSRYSLSI